jgi:hypothetical protein
VTFQPYPPFPERGVRFFSRRMGLSTLSAAALPHLAIGRSLICPPENIA